MGKIDLRDINFSKQVQNEWSKADLWSTILNNKTLTTPKVV
jgi:uncharacterized protein YjbI with pentapeptide repeats